MKSLSIRHLISSPDNLTKDSNMWSLDINMWSLDNVHPFLLVS